MEANRGTRAQAPEAVSVHLPHVETEGTRAGVHVAHGIRACRGRCRQGSSHSVPSPALPKALPPITLTFPNTLQHPGPCPACGTRHPLPRLHPSPPSLPLRLPLLQVSFFQPCAVSLLLVNIGRVPLWVRSGFSKVPESKFSLAVKWRLSPHIVVRVPGGGDGREEAGGVSPSGLIGRGAWRRDSWHDANNPFPLPPRSSSLQLLAMMSQKLAACRGARLHLWEYKEVCVPGQVSGERGAGSAGAGSGTGAAARLQDCRTSGLQYCRTAVREADGMAAGGACGTVCPGWSAAGRCLLLLCV